MCWLHYDTFPFQCFVLSQSSIHEPNSWHLLITYWVPGIMLIKCFWFNIWELKLQEGNNFYLYCLLLDSKSLKQCLALKGEWVNPQGNSGYYCWACCNMRRLMVREVEYVAQDHIKRKWQIQDVDPGTLVWEPHSESLHWTQLLSIRNASSDQLEDSGQKASWCLVWWLSL